MEWEESVLLRKEKWSSCSGKHYYTAVAESSIGRKGGLPQRIGGNVDDAPGGLAVNLCVGSGCVMSAGVTQTLLSFHSESGTKS